MILHLARHPARDLPIHGSARRARCTTSLTHYIPEEKMRPLSVIGLAVLLGLAAPHAVWAQGNHARQGFWFNGGLGYGSLGCENCSGREGALSGGLALGGSLSQKVLLGVGTNGWTKSEAGYTATVGTLTAQIRFYPSATGGFFLLGGLGLGSIHEELSGVGSASEVGPGALVGLGYDFRVGQNVSLTPYWNGFATTTSNADANVGQLGLGVTLH